MSRQLSCDTSPACSVVFELTECWFWSQRRRKIHELYPLVSLLHPHLPTYTPSLLLSSSPSLLIRLPNHSFPPPLSTYLIFPFLVHLPHTLPFISIFRLIILLSIPPSRILINLTPLLSSLFHSAYISYPLLQLPLCPPVPRHRYPTERLINHGYKFWKWGGEMWRGEGGSPFPCPNCW